MIDDTLNKSIRTVQYIQIDLQDLLEATQNGATGIMEMDISSAQEKLEDLHELTEKLERELKEAEEKQEQHRGGLNNRSRSKRR